MVDNAPTHQQEDANAWAGRITGFGNILGFLPGYIDLPKLTGGYFGNQFQILSLIAAFALTSTVIISCLYIHERNPRLDSPSSGTLGVLAFFRQVIKSTRRLPPQIRKVCVVQFFNWIGWFPFLFYITTYVGQIYVNPHFAANPDLTEEQIEKDWEDATRVGTFAYLIFAITSLISSLVLPFLIIPTYRQSTPIESSPLRSSDSLQHHSHPQSNAPGTLHATTSITTSVSRYPIARLLLACQIQWLTLRRAWLLSHILFALCMVSTFFISSVGAATTLVGVIGLPWALSLWAPFALISAEISKRKSEARIAEQRDGTVSANEDKTGINLGLHNVAISAPQIVATLVSSVIFKIAQKPRGSAGDESVAWVLRFGGLSTLIAAYMTYLVDEEGGNMTKTAAEA